MPAAYYGAERETYFRTLQSANKIPAGCEKYAPHIVKFNLYYMALPVYSFYIRLKAMDDNWHIYNVVDAYLFIHKGVWLLINSKFAK